MKHYLDIENLREDIIELPNGITRGKNDQAFEVGDLITITEKYDGANASITWEGGSLHVFSHKKELDPTNTLQGFYNFALGLNENIFGDHPDLIFFGEWNLKNAIVYDKVEVKSHWFVFDIFDKKSGRWLLPTEVKSLCEKCGLEYVAELFSGSFESWGKCLEFSHVNSYGDTQEGIVVRNVSKMNDENNRYPWILKIVNQEFRETKKMNHIKKTEDPQKQKEKDSAMELMATIVTRRRVEKMLSNLRDEGLLPTEIEPKDMGVIAKNMPKRIYEDCLKEEREIVYAAGEYAGKSCTILTMNLVKELLFPR